MLLRAGIENLPLLAKGQPYLSISIRIQLIIACSPSLSSPLLPQQHASLILSNINAVEFWDLCVSANLLVWDNPIPYQFRNIRVWNIRVPIYIAIISKRMGERSRERKGKSRPLEKNFAGMLTSNVSNLSMHVHLCRNTNYYNFYPKAQ